MEYHNLDDFKEEIESLENFFTEFAAREDEILTLGMKRIANWESYQDAAKYLKDFEKKLYEFQVFLRPIDKQLFERTTSLISDSKLMESIIGIEVSLRIATQRQKLTFRSELINTFLFQLPYISNLIRRRKLFSEEIISIQKLIIALGRLKSIVGMAQDTYIHRWTHDSDVFRPSNLDNEKIITLIESAIEEIEIKTFLAKEDKQQLIEYLYKAKSEFAEKRPSWNKIIGALVIVAAITSGMADANGAFNNIDAAIKYILGTSIEKHIPNPLPLLQKPENKKNTIKDEEQIIA